MTERLLTLTQAAEMTAMSVDTIRKAIRTTDPDAFPPPLRAKRASKGLRVLLSDLTAWMRGSLLL